MIVPGTISVPLEQFPPSMIKRESSQPQGETLSATNLRLLPSNRIALNNGWSLLYKDFYSLETEGAGGDGAPETRFVNVFQVFDEKDKLASEIKREDALRADEKARIKKFSRKIERSGKKFFFEIPESYKVDSCGAVDASLFSFKPRVYRGFGDQNLFLGDSVKLATSEGVWTIKVVDLASDGVALEARLNNENTPRLSKRLVKESGGRGGEQQQEVGFETGNEITGVFQGTDLVRGLTSASMLRYATITLNPKKSAQSEEGAEENANGKANGEVKPLGGNQ
jgi:hypothetical protein